MLTEFFRQFFPQKFTTIMIGFTGCCDGNEVKTINLTGKVLKHRYCILEQIGKGGNGSVYLARDTELGVLRAVKELNADGKREARLLVSLEHHCLPKMVDYAENEQYCYIIMERISGESLGERLRRGETFTLEEVLDYGISLTQVLGYLHGRKPPVFYGDMKPDNVMISDSGKLYLIDLGSAVVGYRSVQRVCMGTEGFAAPEQYEGRMGITSDVYALGKTLGALLGKKKRWLWLLCPKLFYVLFRCCLEKETRRYQDMALLEKEFQKIKKTLGKSRIKNMLLAAGCALVFGAAAVSLLFYGEMKPDFYERLTEVTEIYYGEEFRSGSEEERKGLCKEAEQRLQELSRQYQGQEEQRKILSILAVNCAYEGNEEHAAFYYEQMLLYDGSFRAAYGEYGMFLLRLGQKEASEKLWKDYKKRRRPGSWTMGNRGICGCGKDV